MKAWLSLSLFFVISIGFTQNSGLISGTITDADSSKFIPNVSVIIDSLKIGTLTNESGYFEFKSVPAGSYQIRFSCIGYAPRVKQLYVGSGKSIELTIDLIPQIETLKEVVIEDSYLHFNIISKMPYVNTSFSKFRIEQAGARDIGDYMRTSQNISGVRKGGTQIDPVVRGFKFSQLNVVLNNGQKIEGGCPNRMDPATGHVEIDDIKEINVVKGPYDLRYGVGLGAMINLLTNETDLPDSGFIKFNASKLYESNWNGNKEHVKITGGNKWGFVSLTGGRQSYDNYHDGNGNEINSSFDKLNYAGKLGLRPLKNHLLLLSAEEARGRDIRFPALPMDERKDDTQLISADYKIQSVGEVIDFINLKVYRSKVRHEMDNKYRPFSDTTVAISIIHAENTGGRGEIGFNLGIGELIAAADFEKIKKDGQREKYMILQPGLPVKIENLWNNAEIINRGFFALFQGHHKGWEYNLSARVDVNSAGSDAIIILHPILGEIYEFGTDSIESRYTNLSFNGGITRNLNEKFSVSLAAGRAVRSPDMTERFIILLPIGYDQFDYLGDPQLNPEANNQVDITFKYSHERMGDFQLNGFYSLINDFITGRRLPPAVQKPLSKDVLGVKQFYNAGNARLRGFEFSWATAADINPGVSLFASYTYGTLDKSIQYILNDQGEVIDDKTIYNDAFTEIPPFESTLNFYYRMLNGRFVPTFKLRAVASQKHVSMSSYEASTPGFVVAGAGFTYVINSFFKISGGVNNLFDQAYFEHLNRNIIGTKYSLYEPGRSFYVNLFFKI